MAKAIRRGGSKRATKRATKRAAIRIDTRPRPKPPKGSGDDGKVRSVPKQRPSLPARGSRKPMALAAGSRVVRKANVGAAVQTEIDFNGATRLSVEQESPDWFRVSVLA